MKLSEAMRKGAAMHPQCEEIWVRINDDNDVVASCAIGAVMVGLGMQTFDSGSLPDELARELFLVERQLACPKCNRVDATLSGVIFHLNDDHHEPRERIADFLESLGL